VAEVKIIDAEKSHCVAVALQIRHTDRDEVAASCGLEPMEALLSSLDRSTHCWAAMEGSEPVAIFGVGAVSLMSDEGAPWMLAVEGVERLSRHLVTLGRAYVPEMLNLHPRLANHVDARNAASIRWLSRLGFTIDPPAPFGLAGLPFHRFTMEAPRV